jgi:hypothetical protein
MHLLVESEDSPLDVRSLAAWLAERDDLKPVSVAVVGAAAGDDMGVVDEVVRVVFAPGGLAVAVASALGAWAVTRSARTRIRVRAGDKEVEVEAPSSRKAEDIAGAVLRGISAE